MLTKKSLFTILFLTLLLVAGGTAATSSQAAPSATITVTNINDSGAGSLRAAIVTANSNGVDDTIDFSVSGTITLASELVIDNSDSLIINGGGITVSGNNAVRVFNVKGGATIVFNNITIANGHLQTSDYIHCGGGACGGGIAIFSGSNVTINNSTVRDNSVASSEIFSDSDTGGGIHATGTGTSLTVNNSAIFGNDADSGGGIYINSDTATITNSTISGNSATNKGGGIDNRASGTVISSSTITDNSATGLSHGCGIISYGGHTETTLENTIVSGNNCSGGAHDVDWYIGGIFISNGYNLIGTSNGFTSTTGDQTGVTNPMLGALADNGGDTFTHALLPGSPAIDAGDTSLTTDQRGEARPAGLLDDIGAYEAPLLGKIVIAKNTQGGDDTFTFTSPELGDFQLTTLQGKAQRVFDNLASGTYQVAETTSNSEWIKDSVSCSDGSAPDAISLDPGETVTCTFENIKKGSLKLVVNTTGGDDTFNFLGVDPNGYSLTTSGGTAQDIFPGLHPGEYSLIPDLPFGWTEDAASSGCSDGSPNEQIDIGPGESVTCTFEFVKKDIIIVYKYAVGGDDTFDFTSQTLGDFQIATHNGSSFHIIDNLSPGVYDITESVPTGWTATETDPVCSNGDNASSIDLGIGEVVECTFVNLKQDTLVVEKRTIGGDGSFDFTSPQLNTFTLTTTQGAASMSFNGLTPATYSVSETVPYGWVQSGASCDNGDTPDSISMAPGVTVRCTFTNTKQSSIKIIKDTVGGDATFFFTSTELGDFALKTKGGLAKQSFTGLSAGIYDLSESALTGWDQTDAYCSDGSDPASIDLTAGEDVTCTFVNTKRGQLTVVKNTVGSDGTFDFTSNLPGASAFSLTTSQGLTSTTFTDLAVGTYAITETVPAGWQLTRANCSDGSRPDNISIDPGENVTCTFGNTRLDTIIVMKRAVGGDETFSFNSTALGNFDLTTVKGKAHQNFSNLAPGTYDVSETVPAGWTAVEADPVCSNGDNASSISLGAGETVTCVFENRKEDTLVIEKRAVGGDGTFDFTSDLPGASTFSLTTTQGITSTIFTDLAPGTYAITETVPAGWDLTNATCDNGDAPGAVTLASGETVVCIFENSARSSLMVVKHTLGGDGSFDFTSASLGDFNLTTSKETAEQVFTDLAPGTYDLQETLPAGWQLDQAACSDGSDPANINLDPGEDLICSFENTKQATLLVVKETANGDGSFDFVSGKLGDFSLITSNGTAQQTFYNLNPGTYHLAETVPANWALTSATCSNGQDPSNLGLAPGEEAVCTFVNDRVMFINYFPIILK